MALWGRKESPAGAATEDPAAVTAGHVASLLQDAAAAKEPAFLLWPDLMALSKATIGGVQGENVVLINPSRLKETQHDPTLPISVTFALLGRVHAFVTWFVAFQPAAEGQDGARLLLKIPLRVAASDNRAACRVPVLPTTPLRIQAMGPDRKVIQPKPFEISLAGVGLDLSEGCGDPGWREGSRLDLILKLGGEEEDQVQPLDPIKLAGVVRRKEGPKLSIYFPECLSADGLQPPPELKTLFKSLERIYLQSRADLEGDEEG